MSSQRKIDANKMNATRSTGPRTASGKIRASRNAVRHGLTAKFGTAETDVRNIEILAKALASEDRTNSTNELRAAALAEMELIHIRKVRAQSCDLFGHPGDTGAQGILLSELLTKAENMDRYERRAISRKRKAFTKILSQSVS
jgi:hypothetical protein